MPIRDDSAGPYGNWNDDDLSWLDFIKAKASDGGNALSNLGRNLVDGFSPVGTSEQGNMALQVPPIVSGIANSYSRLAGTPSQPGNAYDLTGVPELDAPIQQDMSNVLLSLYGGNAVSGLAKPKGALGAGAMSEEAAPPIRAYRGITNDHQPGDHDRMFSSSDPDIASTYAISQKDGSYGAVMPLDLEFNNPLTLDAGGRPWHSIPYKQTVASTDDISSKARELGHDGLVIKNVVDSMSDLATPATTYVALKRGTVRSPLTGETLFSDTGKPSIFGSAMATGGENRSFGSSADLAGSPASAVNQAPSILDRIPSEFSDAISPSESFQPRGVYRMSALESLINSKVLNAPGTQRMRNGEMVTVPPLNDLANAAEALSPYDISALDQAWRNKTRQTGELFSKPIGIPQQQNEDLPPWLRF